MVSVNPTQALGGTASDANLIVDDAFERQTSLMVGPRGTDFSIWLVYHGTNREPHLYQVYSSMLVTFLYNRIASRILHCEPSDFHPLVQGNHLWHSGSITDRLAPLTLQPTCFLAPRTVVTVKMIILHPDFIQPAGPVEEQLEELPDPDDEQLGDPDKTFQIEDTPCDAHERSRVSPSGAIVGDEELERLYRELSEIKAKILARWAALFATNSKSQQGSSSAEESPSTLGGQPAQDPLSRRTSSRRTIPRVPYTGGSGGGLARKDSKPADMRRPVRQRWFYDSVPVLIAQSAHPDSTTTDDVVDFAGQFGNRVTLQEGSQEEIQPLIRIPAHGEPVNGELIVAADPL